MDRPENDIEWLRKRRHAENTEGGANSNNPSGTNLLNYIEFLEANAIREVRADEVTDEDEWKRISDGLWRTDDIMSEDMAFRDKPDTVVFARKRQTTATDKVLSIAAESGVGMTREQADAFAAYFKDQLS